MQNIEVKKGRIFIDGNEIPFQLHEIVPNRLIARFGDSAIWYMDPRTVLLIYFTRSWFDAPMIINRPDLQGRGFRFPEHGGIGSLSQHKFGRAYDFNIKGLDSLATYREVMDNRKAFMDAGLTTVEDIEMTPTWNHHDIRYTGMTDLLIVRP